MRPRLLSLALWLLAATAAQGQWHRTNGPDGGTIAGLAASDSSCFATTATGFYRSTDAGITWTQLPSPLPEVTAITAFGRSVIVGGREGAILRSEDDGITWSAVQGGFPAARVTTILRRNALIVIGFFDELAKGRNGLYESFDGGATWMKMVSGLDENSPYFSVAASSSSLFAAGDGGLFRSTNNGADWSGPHLTSARLVAADGEHIAAATYDRIYFSANNGDAWSFSPTGFPEGTGIGSLAYHRGVLFCGTIDGLYRSTDYGESWSRASAGITSSPVSALASAGDLLLAGTGGGGVHRSADIGISWSLSSRGIVESTVISLLPLGDDLYAGTSAGVFRSPDRGATWMQSGLSERIPALAVAGGAILAGTQDSGIYRTTDQGTTWVRSDAGLSDRAHHVHALLAVGNDVYAGTLEGIYRSADGGLSWSPASSGVEEQIVAVNALAGSADDLYAGLGGFIFNGMVGGVYRSTDRGAVWTGSELKDHGITALAARYPHVWAGGMRSPLNEGEELYHSTDRGMTWTRTPFTSDPYPHGVSAIHITGQEMLIGTDIGVFLSTDDGITWREMNDDFGPAPDVRSLASRGEDLYAGVDGDGVWRRNGAAPSSVGRSAEIAGRAMAIVPNPASGDAALRYRTGRSGRVTIELRDPLGRRVGPAIVRHEEPGEHAATLDLRSLAAGIYYCVVMMPEGSRSLPVTIVR